MSMSLLLLAVLAISALSLTFATAPVASSDKAGASKAAPVFKVQLPDKMGLYTKQNLTTSAPPCGKFCHKHFVKCSLYSWKCCYFRL